MARRKSATLDMPEGKTTDGVSSTSTSTSSSSTTGTIPPDPPVALTSENAPPPPIPATSSIRRPKYYQVSEWLDDDRVVLWNSKNNRSFAIRKEEFLLSTNIGDNLLPVAGDYEANAGEKLLVKADKSITITLPPNPVVGDRIEIVGATNFTEYPLQVRTNGQPFEGTPATEFTGVELTIPYQSAKLVYTGEVTGWISAPKVWSRFGKLPAGYRFFMEGSLQDQGPLNRAVIKTGATLPIIAPRLNNKPGIIFNGTDQRISVAPFMQDATAGTVYIVFGLDNYQPQYNILRTNSNIEELLRHGNGWSYTGIFCDRRVETYHMEAPTNGYNLISWHVATNRFQIVQNGKNYGIRTGANFSPGNVFEFGSTLFRGCIMSALVYPFEILPSSEQHRAVVDYFYKRYPALPWTAYIP